MEDRTGANGARAGLTVYLPKYIISCVIICQISANYWKSDFYSDVFENSRMISALFFLNCPPSIIHKIPIGSK